MEARRLLPRTLSCVFLLCLFLTNPSLTVIITGVLGIVARHFASVAASSQDFLSGSLVSVYSKLILDVLSCSNLTTGTNPYYFPNQNLEPQYTTVNDTTAQAVNFHIEPYRIRNLFAGNH